MMIHDEAIQLYVKDKPIPKLIYKVYPTQPAGQPDPKRKEVVMELFSRILPILNEHTFFNIELCRKLFHHYDKVLDTFHFHFLVHAPKGYDIYTKHMKDATHIYIDLIQVADHTPIVSQMMYILEHEISRVCLETYLSKKLGKAPASYLDALDYDTFKEGLVELLSWNNAIDTYRFNDESYEQHKQKAFGSLYEIMQIDQPNEQTKVLFYLNQASFWERYTCISGMFYLFDIYTAYGADKLCEVYQNGYQNFVKTIFS